MAMIYSKDAVLSSFQSVVRDIRESAGMRTVPSVEATKDKEGEIRIRIKCGFGESFARRTAALALRSAEFQALVSAYNARVTKHFDGVRLMLYVHIEVPA